MSHDVNPPKRRYNSARRKAQAEETRRHILSSAETLFLRRGYTGTTIEGIAGEAGVSVETIYAAFRNKRTILARLVDRAVTGDEEPIPLIERAGPQETAREPNQEQQVRLFVQGVAEILQRVGPLFEVMRLAASTEPEIKALLGDVLQQRLNGMTFFIDALRKNGPLRGDQDVATAAEVTWTITSPEVYRLLTESRQWSQTRYESWLGDTLTALLLPEGE